TCRACGSHDLDLVFALKPTPIGDDYVTAERLGEAQPSYPIDLFMCGQCGLAQITDIIDPDVLYGNYIYVTQSSPGLHAHFH
ncbi:class I SAM-dependent methyltransferase, partial [Streptomyces scabiei]